MSFSLQDHQFMARAVQLARQGRFTTTPNPNVGCVVVKNGSIVGEGWHQKAGTGHAEVNALKDVPIEISQGATAYVTLEPCSHFGRTPPCAQRLIEAKVARVVVAMLDPNPRVAGQGIKQLKTAGIQVETGLLEADARLLNPGFLMRMEQKRPFVQVKLAASLDGKTALENGESKWITSSGARADVQKHRAEACAIISTAQTVLADDAKLNVRPEALTFDYPQSEFVHGIRQPARVILDGQGKINAEHVQQLALFQQNTPIFLIRHKPTGAFDKLDYVESVVLPYQPEAGFDLNALLQWCNTMEWGKIWVEAGGTLAASFVRQGLFDELLLYQAPKILGMNGREVLPIGPFSAMSDVCHLRLVSTRQVGEDVKLTFSQLKN